MRLKNIYYICKKNCNIRQLDVSNINGSNDKKIKNWQHIFKSLQELNEIDIIKPTVKQIFEISPLINSYENEIRISPNQYNTLASFLSTLSSKISTIVELCESLDYKLNENGFDVKIPESDNLDDYIETLSNLKKFLNLCPFIKLKDADIKMYHTDVGTTWIIFIVIGGAAIKLLENLGKVIEEALTIRNLKLECESHKENLRAVEDKNGLLEKITDLYDQMIDTASVASTKKLESETEMKLGPEDKEKSKKSIKSLGELITKGVEIYSAIEAPEEVTSYFPPKKEQKKLMAPKKQLREKAESINEENNSTSPD